MTQPADIRTTMSAAEMQKHLRRAVIASTVGTAIEWYDFFLYSSASALVFAHLYFPKSDPLVGTLQAFLIFAVGFIARPIGAAIFGHFGDRIGRKSSLVATLLLMGIATFLVALVPTYDEIGIWGAVALTLLRFVQGIGVGGEWGGSIVLSMEWAGTDRNRGFIASWPQFGVPAGLFLANLAVLGFSKLSGDQFLQWGWRLPFLLSGVLVGLGLYIRLGILESPVFSRLLVEKRIEKVPLVEAVRQHWREILIAMFLRLIEMTPFYLFTVFVFAYGTETLHASRNLLLFSLLCASVLAMAAMPLAGHLSDRFGRRRTYLTGVGVMAVWGFVYFWLLNTGNTALIVLAISFSLVPHALVYGPQAALIAEMFTGRLRYSGASLGYQLASVVAGGPAPLIAAAIYKTYGSGYAIALYILACAGISFVAALNAADYTGKDIAAEYEPRR